MTAQLKLSRNWDYCPVPWQNFVKSIQYDRGPLPESVFWLLARYRLREEHNAELIDAIGRNHPDGRTDAAHYECIEFKRERDLTMFLLRWSS